MRTLARSVWRQPRPSGARGPGRLDVVLLVALAVAAVLEVLAQPDEPHRISSLVAFLAWLPTLAWRRSAPLAMPAAFAVVSLVQLVVTGTIPAGLDTSAAALLMPYSLARWARGPDAVAGLVVFASVAALSLAVQEVSPGDLVGAAAVMTAATAAGVALRSRSVLRDRALHDVRRAERERLARDLHDTVAHHLTAIAISAQAGLAVAPTRPEAAVEALRRIDAEASRTLAETRKVVHALRSAPPSADEPVPGPVPDPGGGGPGASSLGDDVPERPLHDLLGLASGAAAPGPPVRVRVAADLSAPEGTPGALSPTLVAAAHRIAQEGVANARRHARDATAVTVDLRRRGDDVVLSVTDDGRATGRASYGFGIVGMTERAELLGGTLEAGPLPEGGWRVRAVLPVGTT